MTKKTDEATTDEIRDNTVKLARNQNRPMSFYVDKRDKDGNRVGRVRTLPSMLEDGLAVVGQWIIIDATTYDGNAPEIGRPVRLVLSIEEADTLSRQLRRWVSALTEEEQIG